MTAAAARAPIPKAATAALVLGLVVALGAGWLTYRARQSQSLAGVPPSTAVEQAPKVAPDFTLKDGDGKPVHLSDYRGKVVLLDFWATWCGPCRIEIPWFTDLERKNKDRGFAVLGVAMDDDGWKAIKPFMADMKMNYRVLLGDDQTAHDYGGLDALPTTFLINRDGKIVSVHVGLTSRKDFEEGVEKLLQQPPPNPSVSGLPPAAKGKS